MIWQTAGCLYKTQRGSGVMKEVKGAFYTGKYRNLFEECGYTRSEIEERLHDTWQQLFYGDDETRIYYPVGTDAGYILDTGNLDVRTEGMSYGMMMCVQMNKKEEFDRIWTWTKRYMWHAHGKYAGYFAWSLNPDGTRRAEGPAPDGEEYFALALLFASHRWGDGPEPYNYSEQAKELLRACLHREDGMAAPLWEKKNKLIKFIPESDFTDPSYHLPHFYELFASWGNPEDKEFWQEAAKASRAYLKKACHPVTGLAPEYANYDGTPRFEEGHGDFFSDSYRVVGNIALDYEWFGGDDWAREEANKWQNFFGSIDDLTKYHKYTVEGDALNEMALHPVGLLAMNAFASLAATGPYARKFVETFWRTPLRKGKRRYYDNCLYFFSLLALSGNYRIW